MGQQMGGNFLELLTDRIHCRNVEVINEGVVKMRVDEDNLD